MPAEVVIDLTYALYSLVFAGGAFDWTTLLDPWGIFGIAGRPQDAATKQVINRLRQSPNPAARLWSIELTRGLNDFGLVISTGGSGRSILDAWSGQFVNNLVAQGVSKTRAQEIAINAMSRQAQSGAPLEPELLAPMPEGMTFNGPQSVADTFLNGVKYWNARGFKGPSLIGHAENFVLSHSTAADLTALTVGQPAGANTTLPTATTSLGSCQAGYTYDQATELCWPTPPPAIPPGGTTIPQPGPNPTPTPTPGPGPTVPPEGGDDGQNDEIGDYGDAILADLDTVVALLQNLGQDDPNGCLCLIAAAVPGITSALTAILASLPTGGAPPTLSVDLTGVTAAVEDLVAAVKALNIAIPPATAVDLTAIDADLKAIADALGTAPTDVSGIVDQLKIANAINDVPTALLNQLMADDLMPGSYAQFLQGSPPPIVKTISDDAAAVYNSIHWKKDLDVHLRRLADIYNFRPTKTTEEYWKMAPLTEKEVTTSIGDEIAGPMTAVFDVTGAIFQGPIKALLKVHADTVATLRNVKPGDEVEKAATLLGEAVGAGVSAHFAAVAAEASYPTKNLGFPQMAALMAELAGFAEIMKGIIGPEIKQSISIPHTYQINNQARAVQPSIGVAANYLSRRAITAEQYLTLLGYNGLATDYEQPSLRTAFRPIQPRALVNALQDAPFPADQVQAALEDNGYTDANVQFLLAQFEYQSTRNLRQSYVAEAMSAYGQGVISDDELEGTFDDVGWSAEARSLARKRALLLRRIGLAKDAEATIVPEIRSGLLDEESGITQLEDAGIQPWKSQLQATKANASALIAQRRKQIGDAQKLQNERVRNLTRSAEAEFQRGNIDTAALTAALIAIPLDPIVAASIVAVQTAIAQGKQKFVYGKLRSPTAAAALKLRVGTITEQIYKKVITPDQGYQQLSFEDIDAATITQLVATAAAKAGLRFPPGPFIPPLKTP